MYPFPQAFSNFRAGSIKILFWGWFYHLSRPLDQTTGIYVIPVSVHLKHMQTNKRYQRKTSATTDEFRVIFALTMARGGSQECLFTCSEQSTVPALSPATPLSVLWLVLRRTMSQHFPPFSGTNLWNMVSKFQMNLSKRNQGVRVAQEMTKLGFDGLMTILGCRCRGQD